MSGNRPRQGCRTDGNPSAARECRPVTGGGRRGPAGRRIHRVSDSAMSAPAPAGPCVKRSSASDAAPNAAVPSMDEQRPRAHGVDRIDEHRHDQQPRRVARSQQRGDAERRDVEQQRERRTRRRARSASARTRRRPICPTDTSAAKREEHGRQHGGAERDDRRSPPSPSIAGLREDRRGRRRRTRAPARRRAPRTGRGACRAGRSRRATGCAYSSSAPPRSGVSASTPMTSDVSGTRSSTSCTSDAAVRAKSCTPLPPDRM